jgi:hypothetical protein
LHFVVQHRGAHVVVADPAASGEMRVESLEELQRQFPSLSIVLYMQLLPASVQAIVRLAKSGIEHVVLSRFDDEPDRFLELLERIPAHLLSDQMLRELAGSLACDTVLRNPSGSRNAGKLYGWGIVLAFVGYELACLNRVTPPNALPEPWSITDLLVEPPFVPPSQPVNIWTMSQRAGSVSYLVCSTGLARQLSGVHRSDMRSTPEQKPLLTRGYERPGYTQGAGRPPVRFPPVQSSPCGKSRIRIC